MKKEDLKLKGPIEYIKEAITIYSDKENFIFLAKLMAVITIVSMSINYIFSYLFPFQYPEMSVDLSNPVKVIGFILLTIISLIIGLWSQIVRYFSVINLNSDIQKILKNAFTFILKYFLLVLILVLLTLIGTFALVIPAIIFLVWFSFSIYFLLDKKMSIIKSLKESKKLVNGKFFKVFGRQFVFVVITFLISFILTFIPVIGALLSAFLSPLYLLPNYLLYKDLIND